MKLIIGLGNPDKKYENTRHNIGHRIIEFLTQKGLPPGVKAEKTSVYMNESGTEVQKLVNFYKISPEDLYIIHDDLDIPLGNYKIQLGRGPKVHKGLESVEKALGTPDFWRIRVGIDNRDPKNRTPGDSYVLQNFTESQQDLVKSVLEKISLNLGKIIPNVTRTHTGK